MLSSALGSVLLVATLSAPEKVPLRLSADTEGARFEVWVRPHEPPVRCAAPCRL